MKEKSLPPTLHTLVLLTSLGISYLFVSLPSLSRWSLQAVALATLAFFLIKLFNQKKFHHFIPQHASFEVTLVTFIFSLLIGATGNTDSVFYPLIYIYLFLLVFSTYIQSAVVTTLGLMLYLYLLMPATTTYVDMFDLISLPIVLVFFIFAKKQHEELIKEKQVLKSEDKTLTQLETEFQSLKEQLAITQQELDQATLELEQLKQLLHQSHGQLEKLLETNPAEKQKRQIIKIQIMIEEKLKLLEY